MQEISYITRIDYGGRCTLSDKKGGKEVASCDYRLLKKIEDAD